jgi:mRNA interferase MazF
VLIVQADPFTTSRIRTVVVAALTSNLALGAAPGNVEVSRRDTGLGKRSVVNASQLLTLDKSFLEKKAGQLPARKMRVVDEGLRMVLGLEATVGGEE